MRCQEPRTARGGQCRHEAVYDDDRCYQHTHVFDNDDKPSRCSLCRTNGHTDLAAHLVEVHGWAQPGSVFK